MKKDKLRLLITTACPRNCKLCCNKSWNFDKLPVVETFDYKEIMITGGEPGLIPGSVSNLARSIKTTAKATGAEVPKVYVYTAISNKKTIFTILPCVDGIVLTIHDKADIPDFIALNDHLLKNVDIFSCYSLRLNIFNRKMLPAGIDLSMWKVKEIHWIKDCPVPADEDFKRIAKLYL